MMPKIGSLKVIRKRVAPLLTDTSFRVGLVLFIFLLAISVHGQFFLPIKYVQMGTFKPVIPPNNVNILGTDSFGRDIYVQLSYSITNSLKIGITAALVGIMVGSFLGFIAGYYGGIVDAVIRTAIDVMLSIPSLLILLLIASFVRGVLDVFRVALIISLFSWAWPARQARSQVLSLKEREFINVARLSGMSGYEIIIFEIMPHLLQWMTAAFASMTISSILMESSLSVLGLGPQKDLTLGMMLYWALNFVALYRGLWWWWVPVILVLIILFFSLYLMHVGLDRFINPKLRVAREK
ncbi:MAG: ABC transporter permease [Candidatus Brockarchaeota archaeon]|nr:ABC transporter permease [Candidatus Brockarchaeota archaeon]